MVGSIYKRRIVENDMDITEVDVLPKGGLEALVSIHQTLWSQHGGTGPAAEARWAADKALRELLPEEYQEPYSRRKRPEPQVTCERVEETPEQKDDLHLLEYDEGNLRRRPGVELEHSEFGTLDQLLAAIKRRVLGGYDLHHGMLGALVWFSRRHANHNFQYEERAAARRQAQDAEYVAKARQGLGDALLLKAKDFSMTTKEFSQRDRQSYGLKWIEQAAAQARAEADAAMEEQA